MGEDLGGIRAVQTTKHHPPYHEMVKLAIHALKDRNGSSLQAVSKYISNSYFVDEAKCKKACTAALKQGVAKGAIKKVKNSFKLTPQALNAMRAAKRKAKAAAEAKAAGRSGKDRSSSSGGGGGGRGSGRVRLRFPCEDTLLDQPHLLSGRPAVALPEPFPHLEVTGTAVSDLFMVSRRSVRKSKTSRRSYLAV
jgi:hypothetical protein